MYSEHQCYRDFSGRVGQAPPPHPNPRHGIGSTTDPSHIGPPGVSSVLNLVRMGVGGGGGGGRIPRVSFAQ